MSLVEEYGLEPGWECESVAEDTVYPVATRLCGLHLARLRRGPLRVVENVRVAFEGDCPELGPLTLLSDVPVEGRQTLVAQVHTPSLEEYANDQFEECGRFHEWLFVRPSELALEGRFALGRAVGDDLDSDCDSVAPLETLTWLARDERGIFVRRRQVSLEEDLCACDDLALPAEDPPGLLVGRTRECDPRWEPDEETICPAPDEHELESRFDADEGRWLPFS